MNKILALLIISLMSYHLSFAEEAENQTNSEDITIVQELENNKQTNIENQANNEKIIKIEGAELIEEEEAMPFNILVSIAPIKLIIQEIAPKIQIESLLPTNANAHHYSLTPNDLAKIHNATLTYWVGEDLENYLSDVLEKHTKRAYALIEINGLDLIHNDEHEHNHDEIANEEEHYHAIDPHIWLSFENVKKIATKIAIDLEKYNIDTKLNLNNFLAKLTTKENLIKSELSKLKTKPYFVSHDAFRYFDEQFNLEAVDVIHINTAVNPGVKRILELREKLKQNQNSCLFTEKAHKSNIAEKLQKNLKIKIFQRTAINDAKDYFSFIDEVKQPLIDCFNSKNEY